MKPPMMEVKKTSIPEELIQKPRWICWKWILGEDKEKKEKWTKPPINPNTGGNASSTNPSTWSSFDVAYSQYQKKYDGIGFMLGKEYTGVDFDDLRDPNGTILEPALTEIVKLNSYTEISPSFKGLKTLVKGHLPRSGHHGKQIGVFDNGRYFCITGNVIEGVSKQIEARQKEINDLIERFWPEDFREETKPQHQPFITEIDNVDLIEKITNSRQGDKFNRLWSGDISGYPTQSEADLALCVILAFWTANDPTRINALFRQSGLMRDKWDKHGYDQRTISKALSLNKDTYPHVCSVDKYNNNKDLNSFSFSLCAGGDDFIEKDQTKMNKWAASDDKGGMGDGEVLETAKCLLRGGMDLQKISQVLEIIIKSCNLSSEIGKIEQQIRESFKAMKEGERTLSSEVEEFVVSSNGTFLSSDVAQNLNVSSRVAKKNLSKILRHLNKQGVIEKYGNRNGSWRKIDKTLEEQCWWEAKGQPLQVKFPLGIEQWVKLFGGNVILLEGQKSQGKSAFALEFCRFNKKIFKDKILYQNVEMADDELLERFNSYGDIMSPEEWRESVTFIRQSGDWWDKINPDSLNVVDYLIEYKESYLIADFIWKIHQKLKSGIALVIVQRDPLKPYPTGGRGVRDIPRLIISMIHHKVKLEDVKSFYPTEKGNPSGMVRKYKQVNWWHFVSSSDWEYADDEKYDGFIKKQKSSNVYDKHNKNNYYEKD